MQTTRHKPNNILPSGLKAQSNQNVESPDVRHFLLKGNLPVQRKGDKRQPWKQGRKEKEKEKKHVNGKGTSAAKKDHNSVIKDSQCLKAQHRGPPPKRDIRSLTFRSWAPSDLMLTLPLILQLIVVRSWGRGRERQTCCVVQIFSHHVKCCQSRVVSLVGVGKRAWDGDGTMDGCVRVCVDLRD